MFVVIRMGQVTCIGPNLAISSVKPSVTSLTDGGTTFLTLCPWTLRPTNKSNMSRDWALLDLLQDHQRSSLSKLARDPSSEGFLLGNT